MKYKVFLSYSKEDTAKAKNIYQKLKKKGYLPYMAEVYPEPGTFLWERIKREIEDSDCLVVLWTKEGAESQYINQELGCASAFKKPIISIINGGSKRVGVIEGFEYIPYNKKVNRRLLNRLSDLKHEKELLYERIDEPRYKRSNRIALAVMLIIITYYIILLVTRSI